MTKDEILEQELIQTKLLLDHYGPILNGDNLVKVLGFNTSAAFRQAVLQKKLSVRIFKIENRRGYFALATDIAEWIVKQYSGR